MKILQISHSFPPYNMAGTEVYAYNLCRELSKKHEVFVFHRINDTRKAEYEICYEQIDRLGVYSINNTFKLCNSYEETYNNEVITNKFVEILDKVKPDIVHIQHLNFLSTGIIKEVKFRGIPVVYTLHDYWLICPQSQLLKRDYQICNNHKFSDCIDCQVYYLSLRKNIKRIYQICNKLYPSLASFLKKVYLNLSRERLSSRNSEEKIKVRAKHIKDICELVDIFISPSQFLRNKFIESEMVSSKRILFSNLGFNQRLFDDYKEKLLSGKIRFGFIGTFLPHKGAHLLIEAFNRIKAANVELNIYGKFKSYVGFEYYLRYLKKIVVKNKNIKFMGDFDNSNISSVFSNIDVLVVPSIWPENSPLVIQEASMAKTPVIASDAGGIRELIRNDISGLLFTTNSSESLYEKIELLINNPALIEKLRQNIAPVRAIEEDAGGLEKLYFSLIGQQ